MAQRIPVEELLQLARQAIARASGELPPTAAELAARVRPAGVLDRVAPVFDPAVLRPRLVGGPPTPDALESVTSPFRGQVSKGPFRQSLPAYAGYTLPDQKVMPQLAEPLPVGSQEITEPVRTAASLMNKMLGRVLARNMPTRFKAESEGFVGRPRPTGTGQTARRLSPADLRHELAVRLLRDVEKNPARPIGQHIRNIEPGLARWVARRSELLSGVPLAHAEKRRLVAAAEREARRGRAMDDPKVQEARQWLESNGLLEPTKATPRTMQLEALDTPESVFLAKLNKQKTSTALSRISEALKGDKVLTDKQRAALALKFGLEGEGGELSYAGVAKILGIGETPTTSRIKGALAKLRKHIEDAGVTFKEKEPSRLPPDDPEFWPHNEQELANIFGKSGLRYPPAIQQGPPELRKPVKVGQRRLRSFDEPQSTARIPTPKERIYVKSISGETTPIEILEKTVPRWETLPSTLRSQFGLRHPETGKPLFPFATTSERRAIEPEKRLVVRPGPVTKFREFVRQPVKTKVTTTETPARPTPPRKKMTYKEWKDQYRNTNKFRLVKDPAGPVEINGERYRREPITFQYIADPKRPGHKVRILISESKTNKPKRLTKED